MGSASAATLKAQGAAHFSAGEYEAAAAAFADALTLADATAVGAHLLHNNQAAALAALGKHEEALRAAEDALQAGGAGFIKAHYRRAMALQALGRTQEAADACAAGLEAPGGAGNEQLVALQQQAAAAAKPKASLAPEQVAEHAAAAAADAKAWAEGEEQRRRNGAHAAERAREEAARRRRDGLEEAGHAREAELREARLAQRRLASADSLAAAEARRARAEEVSARVHGALLQEGADEPGAAPAAAAAAAAQASARVEAWRVKQLPTRQPLEPPRVPADVTKQFALLRKDTAGWHAYLQLIPPERCAAVFAPELPPPALEHIAAALAEHTSAATAPWAARWLAALREVGRFEMTVLMLDAALVARLRAMFDALEARAGEARAAPTPLAADDAAALDALPKLRACFGVA